MAHKSLLTIANQLWISSVSSFSSCNINRYQSLATEILSLNTHTAIRSKMSSTQARIYV
jgi:hypothetical protein